MALAGGFLGAQFLWGITHHRYDTPNSGIYFGSVTANFDTFGDSIYSLRFPGETRPRWRWRYPTNFVYDRLQIEWWGESREGTATVSLPSLEYRSGPSTGLMSQSTLASWLLAPTNATSTHELRNVGLIFSYIQAAGRGSLPAPSHHGHHFKEPMYGNIQHFLLGQGISGLAYLWIIVWAILAGRFWRQYIKV